jgi:hypothetical protein
METVESKEMPLKGYLPMHPEAILQMHKEKYLMIISNNYRNLANSKYEKAPKNGAFCFL